MVWKQTADSVISTVLRRVCCLSMGKECYFNKHISMKGSNRGISVRLVRLAFRGNSLGCNRHTTTAKKKKKETTFLVYNILDIDATSSQPSR